MLSSIQLSRAPLLISALLLLMTLFKTMISICLIMILKQYRLNLLMLFSKLSRETLRKLLKIFNCCIPLKNWVVAYSYKLQDIIKIQLHLKIFKTSWNISPSTKWVGTCKWNIYLPTKNIGKSLKSII